MACSRIMIATAKLRHYRLRGRGDEETDELTICNAHFNSNTAKKEVKEGAHAYNSFFDELARSMAQFQCRFLCGDFNMALYAVVPELRRRRRRRARGFQINMAAWYCWKDSPRAVTKSDSCGIFRIGPCQGIRMCFDASVFNLEQPVLPHDCRLLEKVETDEYGHEIARYPIEMPTHSPRGHGYPLASYHPRAEARKTKFVLNTFTPVFDQGSSAVVEMTGLAPNTEYFSGRIDTSVGSFSWSLPQDKPSKQKFVKFEQFDPDERMFCGGAHAPLMIFVGANSDGRRKPEAQTLRNKKADARGWDHQRRQSTKQWSRASIDRD